MSQSITARPETAPRPQIEQQIFLHSPFGTAGTVAMIFILLFGSFVLLAWLSHVSLAVQLGPSLLKSSAIWPAFVLSLLCVTALGMQRYVRLADARDAPAYALIMTGGARSAAEVTDLMPPGARLIRATTIGVAVGLTLSLIIRYAEIREGHAIPLAALLWFAFVTTALSILFARGVEQTLAGHRSYARRLNAELKIDLLRIDRLSVLGRSAARGSLIWFVVCAVACLFFVGNDLNWLTVALVVACGGMGLAMFVSAMARIHRHIVAVKLAEIERVRCQIERARETMHDDVGAAARVHGLIAYEKRIEDAPEWPFDQTTLVRVGASTLIVTVPWFGQAVAQYFIEHLAH